MTRMLKSTWCAAGASFLSFSKALCVCQSNVFCESVTIKIGIRKFILKKIGKERLEADISRPMRAKVDHVTDCVFLSDWRRKLSLRREFSPASSQHLSRCRWGGAVAVLADGLDGKIKTGDPLSSFPIRSSVRRARSEECVRAYDLPVPLLLRHRGEWDHGDRT